MPVRRDDDSVSGPTLARLSPRALVVERRQVRSAVTAALREEGFEVRAEVDGSGVLQTIEGFQPDLVLLDVHLPGETDGITFAQRIRASHAVPVIFVTAAGGEQEHIDGFTVGAVDYLVKPFPMRELVGPSNGGPPTLKPPQALGLARWPGGGRRGCACCSINDHPVGAHRDRVLPSGPPVPLSRTGHPEDPAPHGCVGLRSLRPGTSSRSTSARCGGRARPTGLEWSTRCAQWDT